MQPPSKEHERMDFDAILDRLERVEALLKQLVERERVKDWYTIEEAARMVGKAEFTIREYCRFGRIRAEKRKVQCGPHSTWVISHEELKRYQREGLLPDRRLASA